MNCHMHKYLQIGICRVTVVIYSNKKFMPRPARDWGIFLAIENAIQI